MRTDNTLDRRQKLGELNRLDQVLGEAGFPASAQILLHAVAAQSNRFDLLPGGNQRSHQVQAAAVGQAHVADEQVELMACHVVPGRSNVTGCLDRVSFGAEQAAHESGGVGVVLHQQNSQLPISNFRFQI